MIMELKCAVPSKECGFKVNRRGLPICTSATTCGLQIEVPYMPKKAQRLISQFKGVNSDFKRYLEKPLVIVEGEMDLLSCHLAGITARSI